MIHSFRTFARTAAAALLASGLALSAAGCGSTAGHSHDAKGADKHSAAAKHDKKPAPKTIAALDLESAEVLATLGLGKNLVMMPEANMNPVLGSHQRELGSVATKIPVTSKVSAEQIIEVSPELVIVSPRHSASERLGSVLGDAGIDTLKLKNPWGTLAEARENIRAIGAATHREAGAKKLIATLDKGLGKDPKPGKSAKDQPRVLLLSNQAGRPFITAGDAMPLELLARAGGHSVSDDLKIHVTGPITAEQIVAADPDGIVLIDMNGSGDRLFQSLLQNPAVSSLEAMKQDRVLRLKGKQVQALGLTEMADGLNQLRDWVRTLK